MKVHILIVEGRYYEHIADELLNGAKAHLDGEGATHETVTVPGALEVPQALAAGFDTGRFDGAIALGCVIRGETSHYDIVANESARALMELAVSRRWPIGNGILTVDTEEQALARARVVQKNKGRDAAEACLATLGVAAGLRDGPGG